MHRRLFLAGMVMVMAGLWVAFSSFIAWDFTPVNQMPAKLVANFHSREAILQSPKQTFLNVQTRFKTGLENLPSRFRNVEVKGALEVDASGHLLINANVRRSFDFFLFAVEDAPFEQAVARIRAYIDSKLPAQAAKEAHQTLEAYLALKQAVDESRYFSEVAVLDDNLNLNQLLQRKKELTALRIKYLGHDTAQAFFADDDAFDDFCIVRKQLLQDESLSALEKSARIAATERALPEAKRYSIKDSMRQKDLAMLTDEWVRQNGSADELRAIRFNIVGKDAAAELEANDKDNAQWDIRVANWLDQRTKLLRDESVLESERNSRLDFLRSNHFTFEEIPRVKAEERLRDYAYAK